MHRLYFLLFCCCLPTLLRAQKPLSGIVTDPQGAPLAFVSVSINGEPGKGVLTDIEGRFRIDRTDGLHTLVFRYVGYENQMLAVAPPERAGSPLTVVLRPVDYALPEATVRAGENPADILIRKAIARRKFNNPDNRRSYSCNTYNKIAVESVPHRQALNRFLEGKDTAQKAHRDLIRGFEQTEQAMRERHGFLMESVTERLFRFPDQIQENVRLNRVSGFKNTGLVALANMVQPFTFYGDYLTILDKNYVNPISPGSPERYFFNIEDTLYAGPDTVWVVSFHPRKGAVFEALEGVLHLHSNGWAIQNVRARPAAPGNLELKIEQAYQWVPPDGATEGQWFPEQLNFEMVFQKYPSEFAGIRALGRSYITEARVDVPVIQRKMDPEMPVLIDPEANTRSDSAWAPWRALAPLNAREQRTYQWLDSLGQRKHFDRLSVLADALTTGLLPLGRLPLSIDFTQAIRLNDFEGARLGIGLSTAQAKPLLPQKRLEFDAGAGYGFRDHRWKYGGSARWRIFRSASTQLRISWRRDLMEPGTLDELPPPGLVDRSLYAKRMDRTDEFFTGLSSRLGRTMRAQLTLRLQTLQPGYPYRYGAETSGLQSRFRFAETTLFFRFARGERSRLFLGADVGSTQRLPVLEVAYTRGWKGLWQGEFAYDRWALALHQSFFIRRLGHATWRLEAGWVSAQAPLAKLFTLNQTGGDWNLFSVPHTFQALPDTLFLADRFVNLYLTQEIGPVLYKTKRSAPFLTLLQNIAWGDLKRPDLHHDLGFRTASEPLFESGLQIDNLLRLNYFNLTHIGLGGALYYRWGGLQEPSWRDNISARLALKMQF